MKYHFHGRASDIPLVVSELISGSSGYGMFEYYILQKESTLTGYFSDEGAKQMREYVIQNLFDPIRRNKVFGGIKVYDKKLTEFALPGDYWDSVSDKDERLKTYLAIKELLEEFGREYFIMEQPWLLAVEEVVEKACDREGLQHEAVLHDPRIATNFSELEKDLLATLIELGHLKLSVHNHVEPLMQSIYELLRHISKEVGVPLEYAQSMTSADIEEYLRSRDVSIGELELRSKGVIFIPGSKDSRPRMATGKEYERWKEIFEPPFTGEIKGSVACRGKVQGRVTLHLGWINVTEVPRGNILVTGMTNPQMVPYMKHAVGVVTDEGGLACHAAIISREMKIPCIVGTKVATQVLHDGDLVEVDAENGVVRIIERK